MSSNWITRFSILLAFPSCAFAQGSYSVEELKQPPPPSVAPEVAKALNSQGYRLKDGRGENGRRFLAAKVDPREIQALWREGVIQFPFFAESELLGAAQLSAERTTIATRQSPRASTRCAMDFSRLTAIISASVRFEITFCSCRRPRTPRSKILPRKHLRDQERGVGRIESSGGPLSAECAATSAPVKPSMIHDQAKNTWRLVVPLNLSVKGEPQPLEFPVSIIVVGASEAA